MFKNFSAFLALTYVQATFNALQNPDVIVKDNNGATFDPSLWFDFDALTPAFPDPAITQVTFQFPYAIKIKSVYLHLNDDYAWANSVQIWTSSDGLNFTQCGGTLRQTWHEQCDRVLTHFKIDQPSQVFDLCAFIWQANPATPIASMYATVDAGSAPADSPLSITTGKKFCCDYTYFVYSQVDPGTACGDPLSECGWWKMQYDESVYVRYVLVIQLEYRSTVYAYNSNETRSATHKCDLVSLAGSQQYVYQCDRTAQVIELRWPNTPNPRREYLYYVKDFIASDSCETLINGGCSLASLTTGLSSLSTSLNMSNSSTTVPLASVTGFDQSCCPLTWYVDNAATTAGFPVTIDIASQNLIMSPTTAVYHTKTDVTLAVKFVFREGSASLSLSPTNSLQITISCPAALTEKFKIGDSFVESVLTSYAGTVGFPDLSLCLGPNPVYQLIDSAYNDYITNIDISARTFTLDFTKRTSSLYSDGPHSIQVKGTSSSDSTRWYSLNLRLDSIDCVQGLSVPNPLRLKIGSGAKTTDLRQPLSTFFMTSNDVTTITVADSGWTFQDVSPVTNPISSCDVITPSMIADVPGFVTSTANPLVFQLVPSVLSLIQGLETVNMKLQLHNANFPAPQEFPFVIEYIDCIQGLILPNPLRLTIGSGAKTTDLRQPLSTFFLTSTDVTTITVADSGWTFQDVSPVTNPISSCDVITPSMIADVPGFVTSTANPLVFQLVPSVLSLTNGLQTVNMKLQLQNANFPAPQEFPFVIEYIDCIQGLILPNPLRLTIGSGAKTTDLRQPLSTFFLTSTDVTTITVADSGWTFQDVSPVTNPISSCDVITPSMIADVPGFVTSTANPLVFQLVPSVLSLTNGLQTVNMKLQLQNANFPAPQEFPFVIEYIDCIQGLILPNPLRLTIGSGAKTTDLRQPLSTFFLTSTDVTTITVADSGWTFQDVSPVTNPISSCDVITPSMIADVPGFVTSTANPLVFQLVPSVLSLIQGLETVNMKLQLHNANFPVPQEFPFVIEYQPKKLQAQIEYQPKELPAQIEYQDPKSECESTAINLKKLSDVEIDIGETIDIPLEVTDSVSIKRQNPAFCGPIDFKIYPSLKFFSISDSKLTIKPTNFDQLGDHDIDLFATLANFKSVKNAHSRFRISVFGNTEPYVKDFVDSIEMKSAEERQILVGSINDKETPDLVTAKLEEASCNDSPVNWINLIIHTSPDYKIELVAKAPEVDEDLKCRVKLTISDNDKRKPLVLTKAVDLVVKPVQPVKYTSDMKPSSEILKKFTFNSTATQKVSANSSGKPPIVKSKQMSLAGQAVIRFSEDITFVNDVLNLTSTNEGPLFFNITLIVHPRNLEMLTTANDDQTRRLMSDMHEFEWSVTKPDKASGFAFDFDFVNPDIISKFGTDKMKIELLHPQLLVSSANQTIPAQFREIELDLPQQLPSKSEASLTQGLATSTVAITSVILASSMALSLFLKSVIFFLWGLINQLQLSSLTIFFSVRLPASVMNFLKVVIEVGSFDIFHAEPLLKKIFNFEDTPSYNAIFQQGGYEGQTFILGVAPMFVVACLFGIFQLVRWLALKYMPNSSPRFKKIRQKLEESGPNEAAFIRFVLESNIDFMVWSIIALALSRQNQEAWHSFAGVFSNLLAIAVWPIMLLAQGRLFYLARRLAGMVEERRSKILSGEPHQLDDEIERISPTFDGLKQDLPSLMSVFLFVVKRQLVVLCIVVLPASPAFQVLVYVWVTFSLCAYTAAVKPNNSLSMNIQNMINEATLLMCSYHLLLFSDSNPDDARFFGTGHTFKAVLGWSMLATIFVGIVINVLILVTQTVVEFKQWLRNRQIDKMRRQQSRRADQQKPILAQIYRDKVLAEYRAEEAKEANLLQLNKRKKKQIKRQKAKSINTTANMDVEAPQAPKQALEHPSQEPEPTLLVPKSARTMKTKHIDDIDQTAVRDKTMELMDDIESMDDQVRKLPNADEKKPRMPRSLKMALAFEIVSPYKEYDIKD